MVVKESIFWNLIRILWPRKKFIVISILATALITFIVTSLMPKTYKASLTFIVNEEDTGFNISSLLSDLPLDIGSVGNKGFDKYLALLGSRRVRDVLIEKFDLWEEYGEEYIEFLYKELDGNIEVTDNFDGTISINTYFQSNPQKAADMAQTMYDEMYAISLQLRQDKTRNYREFLERSLNETYATLGQLEDSLKVFQMENNILILEEQATFSFKALGELEAQNMMYSVEHDYLKNALAPNSPELKEVKSRLEAIQKTKENLYKNGEEYILAFGKLPDIGLTYFRLVRDITVQQEILKFLLPVVHNARAEEKKETVNVQIIDAPFTPQYKVAPKRLTYMIVLCMLLFIGEVLYFSVRDAYTRNKKEIQDWVVKDGK